MAEPGFEIVTFTPAQGEAPEQAVELFGNEVADYFDRAADEATLTPVVLAAIPRDGEDWMAGVFLLIERPRPDAAGGSVASIRQLVVQPAYRGRGIAGWLLRRSHSLAQEMGCDRIRSTAGWGCPDHMSMYDRIGYERVRNESPYLVAKTL